MKTLILLVAFCLSVIKAESQNYKFQALYLYNIAQNIEWSAVGGDFKIGVVGCNEIEKELVAIFKTRNLGGLPVTVTSFSSASLSGVETCRLVYLSRTASSKMANVNAIIQNKPVLLVSDKVGLTGAGVNLIDESTKLEFEIYPSVIKAHGLKLSNSLLNLGVVKQ